MRYCENKSMSVEAIDDRLRLIEVALFVLGI